MATGIQVERFTKIRQQQKTVKEILTRISRKEQRRLKREKRPATARHDSHRIISLTHRPTGNKHTKCQQIHGQFSPVGADPECLECKDR